MTAPLYALARFCVRRRRVVLAAWLLGVVGLAVLGVRSGGPTSDDLSLPGTDSKQATDLLQERFPQQQFGSNPVVVRARQGTLQDAGNASGVADVVTALQEAPHVTQAVSPLSPEGVSALSQDAELGYVSTTLDLGQADLDADEAEDIIDPARAAGEQANLEVEAGGYLGQEVSKPATHSSEVIGIGAAIVVLLLAFGSAVAMSVPIATALLGLVGALSIVALLGNVIDVPTVAPTLATMIGLGVGIDYSLFAVTRHRSQLRDGMAADESVARATAIAGSAILFAGGTVVIALCSLAVAGIPIVSNLGFSAAVAVLVAVTAALTLLPALLGLLGDRINHLRLPFGHHGHPEEAHGWARWARAVARWRWPAMVASAAVLAVLAIPVLGLRLGQSDVGALPESTTARKAYDLIREGFGVGTNGPLLVAASLKTPVTSPTDPGLTQLGTALGEEQGVASVSPPTLDDKGDAAIYTVISATSPSSRKTEHLVNRLRSDAIPQGTSGTDISAHVGGQTAAYVDLADEIGSKLPLVIGVVVALGFLLLLVGTRSLLLPAQAALLNLLSVGAAYGVLTAVFQNGWGNSLIGLDHPIPIVSFVPLLMFAILFGLSMDYQVFLVSRVQERYRKTQDNERSVIEGLTVTGRVITAAALIMVSVFASFVLNGDPTVKQFGVGLAAAIAIDATIVRCLLGPSVMVLFGRANWWLPGWLDRLLPDIGLEGEEALPKTRKPPGRRKARPTET